MPTGPSLLWSEVHYNISISEGLFSVILGSQSGLPVSTFTGTDRYLGIKIGDDSEMSPRTLLTSAPSAAYAKSVKGDIETGEGTMLIRTALGDSAFVFNANGGSLNIFDEIGQVMGFEPSPFNEGYSIKFIDPADAKNMLSISGNHINNKAKITFIEPGDDGVTPAMEMATDPDGSYFHIVRLQTKWTRCCKS